MQRKALEIFECVKCEQPLQIELLDAKARREEVARMLGGIEITRQTLAHAKEMLEKATG